MFKHALILTIAISLLLFQNIGQAKQSKTLSLKEAVLLAMRLNPEIRSAEIQRVADKFNLEAAYYEFEPNFSIEGSSEYSKTVSSGATSRSISNQISPQMTYKTPYGTQYTFRMDHGYNFNPGEAYSYNPRASLEVKQPLMRGSGRAVVTAALNQSIIGEQNNKLALKETMISIINQVINAYYQVILDKRNLDIQKMSVINSEVTIRIYKAKIKSGDIAPAELNDVQNNLYQDRLNVVATENQLKADQQNLLVLLGLEPHAKIDVIENFPLNQYKVPTMTNAVRYALKNNVNYQRSTNNLADAQIQLITAKDASRWELDLTGNVSTGAGAGTGRDAHISSLYNGHNTEKSIRLDLSIPILNKDLKAQVVSAEVNLARQQIDLKNQKRELETDVINAIRTLNANLESIKLAIETSQYARKSYNVTRKKIAVGLSTTFELTTKNRILTNAELQVVQAEITFLSNYANFDALLGRTLERWNLDVVY